MYTLRTEMNMLSFDYSDNKGKVFDIAFLNYSFGYHIL